MKTVNFEQAKALGWCWFNDKELTERLERYAERKPEWTALDILRLPSEEVTDDDKLFVVLCRELIDEKIIHALACDFAERALSRAENPHPHSVKAIEVKRRWIRGEATDEELSAARDAASSAARDAAGSAAWYAARDAARARQVAHVIEVLEGLEDAENERDKFD